MKKLLTSGIIGTLIIASSSFANTTTTNYKEIVKNYEKNGLKSKSDFEKYKKAFNQYAKNKNNLKIDKFTVMNYLKILPDNTIELSKTIHNSNKLADYYLEKLGVDPKKVPTKEKRKIITYNSKSVAYLDATNLCSALEKMNYFKYGKFREKLNVKETGEKFIIEIHNRKECMKTKKDFIKLFKEFIKYSKKLSDKYKNK